MYPPFCITQCVLFTIEETPTRSPQHFLLSPLVCSSHPFWPCHGAAPFPTGSLWLHPTIQASSSTPTRTSPPPPSSLCQRAHPPLTRSTQQSLDSSLTPATGAGIEIHISWSGDARTRRRTREATQAATGRREEKRSDLHTSPEVRHDTQEDIAGGSRSQRRIKKSNANEIWRLRLINWSSIHVASGSSNGIERDEAKGQGKGR